MNKSIYEETVKDLIKLIERDTPKKPIVNIDNEIKEYNCGVCVCRLDIPQLREVNFCPKCGQRLDWNFDFLETLKEKQKEERK